MSDALEILLRLGAAVLAGMAIGLNRDVAGKPMGARTLGLVALGAAIVTLAATHDGIVAAHPDARSRVLQGVFQGVLTGVGFIGAGLIIQMRRSLEVHHLTTAATVLVVAGLGITAALGEWVIVTAGTAFCLAVLVIGKPMEDICVDWLTRLRKRDPL